MKSSKFTLVSVLAVFSGFSVAAVNSFVDSFDNLPGVPDEAKLNPVGVYNNVDYVNFNVGQPGLLNETLNGVMPHSKPNLAVLAQSPGTLTVAYSGSIVKSLTVKSFYYGCNVNAEQGVVSSSVDCTVTVTGYKAGKSTPSATQVFTYTAAETVDLMQAMDLATLSSQFQNLQSVQFAVSSPSTTSLLMDDVIGSTQS